MEVADTGVTLHLKCLCCRPKVQGYQHGSEISIVGRVRLWCIDTYGKLSIKGASGIKPCVKCANVLMKSSGLADRHAGLVEIDCADRCQFVSQGDRDVWRHYDQLGALKGNTTVVNFERHERAMGITWSEHGILGDRDLRAHMLPVSSLTFDWQHTFLSNGIVSQEIFEFFAACRRVGMKSIWQLLEQYCQADWSFPYQHQKDGKAIHRMFNNTREKASSDHFKSGASELLSAYPLIRRFAESVVVVRFGLQLHGEVRSLRLCCKVLDLLQDCKGGPCDTRVLHEAMQSYLEAHKAAYGSAEWKPKFHYGLHIPEQIDRDQRLYDCFVVERSHQLPKFVATAVKNTGSFEKSVIARAFLHRLQALADWDERPGLRGKKAFFEELGITLASAGYLSGMTLNAGDLVLAMGYVISLTAVAEQNAQFGLLGYTCELVHRSSSSCATYKLSSSLSFLWLEDRVRRAHCWSASASGELEVLLPDLQP